MFNEPIVLIQGQQVSAAVFDPWSDGSSSDRCHYILAAARGYKQEIQQVFITSSFDITIQLFPQVEQEIKLINFGDNTKKHMVFGKG